MGKPYNTILNFASFTKTYTSQPLYTLVRTECLPT